MSSMQTVSVGMVMTYQNDANQGNASDNSSGTCCDAMGTFSLACDFMVSQFTGFALYGGSKQVVNSDPSVQSIYIEAILPPPKA